jgi:hypothetical protein
MVDAVLKDSRYKNDPIQKKMKMMFTNLDSHHVIQIVETSKEKENRKAGLKNRAEEKHIKTQGLPRHQRRMKIRKMVWKFKLKECNL